MPADRIPTKVYHTLIWPGGEQETHEMSIVEWSARCRYLPTSAWGTASDPLMRRREQPAASETPARRAADPTPINNSRVRKHVKREGTKLDGALLLEGLKQIQAEPEKESDAVTDPAADGRGHEIVDTAAGQHSCLCDEPIDLQAPVYRSESNLICTTCCATKYIHNCALQYHFKECDICYLEWDSENKFVFTPCGHFFCVECWELWVEGRPFGELKYGKCPTCVSSIDMENIFIAEWRQVAAEKLRK